MRRIYTDGACKNNQAKANRRAGYGIVVEPRNGAWVDVDLPAKNRCKRIPNGGWLANSSFNDEPLTNNRAEMMAIVRTLDCLLNGQLPIEKSEPITVYCDNQYVLDILSQTKTAHTNLDMVEKMFALTKRAVQEGYKLHVKWIRGHTSKPEASKNSELYLAWFGNRIADQLANRGCE